MLLLILKILIVVGTLQITTMYLVYIERKVCAYIQDRIGPNRVGWHGLLQPVADGVKLILKEPFIPEGANKLLFVLAPAVAVFTTMIGFAVVPFGPTSPGNPDATQFVIAPGIDVGILFVFAVSSLAVYSVILGGWSSNNKYSFLGAMRSSAQFVSYEIPLGLSILGVVLIARSLNLERIIDYQADDVWFVFYQPVACLLFFTSALAESNRLPFDLPECEQELIGGYHTEYSGFRWCMFFVGEYTHMITVSFLTAILFFGGWDLPRVLDVGSTSFLAVLAKMLVLLLKAFALILFMMWLRWTLPRFRFDQLMTLAWKVLIPLALLNLLITAVGVQIVRSYPESLAPVVRKWVPVFWAVAAGAVVLGLLYQWSRRWTRQSTTPVS